MHLPLPESWANVHAEQANRSQASHESARPAPMKILFVAPDHFESGAIRFFPNETVVEMVGVLFEGRWFVRGKRPRCHSDSAVAGEEPHLYRWDHARVYG